MDVVQFVDADAIDPVYYRSSYYLAPEESGQKAYSLLRLALAEKNRIGIAKVALRARVHLAALRARDDVLILETMYWPDEIRSALFDGVVAEPEVRETEMAMAEMLIDNLSAEFDPSYWVDATRERIEELAHQKIEGRDVELDTRTDPGGHLRRVVRARSSHQGELLAEGRKRPAVSLGSIRLGPDHDGGT